MKNYLDLPRSPPPYFWSRDSQSSDTLMEKYINVHVGVCVYKSGRNMWQQCCGVPRRLGTVGSLGSSHRYQLSVCSVVQRCEVVARERAGCPRAPCSFGQR